MPQEVIVQSHCAEFPAVSGPSLVVLPNGSLLAVFNNVSGGIFEKISNDNGETWSPPFQVKGSGMGYEALGGPCLIDGNKLFLFYLRWQSYNDSTGIGFSSVWKLESFDNGQIWQNDMRIDSESHNYTLLGMNSLRMRNGTLIVPISWNDRKGVYNASVLRSDDDGVTWLEGDPIHIPDRYLSVTGIDEPSVIELTNSSIYCLLRTNVPSSLVRFANVEAKHVYSISNDYGLTWEICLKAKEMFAFNTSPAVLRFSWSPNIVLATWINRISMYPYIDDDVHKRRPLVVAYSLDDCNTWKATRIIDDGDNINSMNEPNFAVSSKYILLGYRRYSDLLMSSSFYLSDAVIRRFTLNLFADIKSITETFGSHATDSYWNPCTDMNSDGVIDILDAIIFACYHNN